MSTPPVNLDTGRVTPVAPISPIEPIELTYLFLFSSSLYVQELSSPESAPHEYTLISQQAKTQGQEQKDLPFIVLIKHIIHTQLLLPEIHQKFNLVIKQLEKTLFLPSLKQQIQELLGQLKGIAQADSPELTQPLTELKELLQKLDSHLEKLDQRDHLMTTPKMEQISEQIVKPLTTIHSRTEIPTPIQNAQTQPIVGIVPYSCERKIENSATEDSKETEEQQEQKEGKGGEGEEKQDSCEFS